ncbi:NUDIX hydrolase [Salinibaculum rarum]|uniref:NUDIX hydrolase n=1 Tax=Salinibaculum rarum TaxID=3058903 RepID=UPI00265EAA1E|nr:NUDIX domain-containing protein [Salinibaculum sp. KK48]
MTSLDDLWYLADEAAQQAEQTYHDLQDRYEETLTFETTKYVSRPRFRTVASRIQENGAPYGAHTLVTRPSDQLLLVRHAGVGMWVLPGGETEASETFREGAERELEEEAGVTAAYDGMGLLGSVQFVSGDHSTWGVLPVFEATVHRESDDPTVADPDDEITAAQWFSDLPEDTRDREQLRRWRDRRSD